MAKKYITIGTILSLIAVLALLIWWTNFSSSLISNPTDPKNIEKIINKTVEEATPSEANIVLTLAPPWHSWSNFNNFIFNL